MSGSARLWLRSVSEELLDCCVPLHKAKETGITLDQFICLALCNGASAVGRRGAPLEEFRSAVRLATSSTDDNHRVVVSYSRSALGQTGSGHFSPIAAFHPAEDMVLILDVARFKYPPHWVPLAKLWEAMNTIDSETGQLRGFACMGRRETNASLPLFFRLVGGPNEWRARLTSYITTVSTVSATNAMFQVPGALQEKGIFAQLCAVALLRSGIFQQVKAFNLAVFDLAPEHQEPLKSLSAAIEATELASHISQVLSTQVSREQTVTIVFLVLGLLGAICDVQSGQICELCGDLPPPVRAAATHFLPEMFAELPEPVRVELQALKGSLQAMIQPACCTKPNGSTEPSVAGACSSEGCGGT